MHVSKHFDVLVSMLCAQNRSLHVTVCAYDVHMYVRLGCASDILATTGVCIYLVHTPLSTIMCTRYTLHSVYCVLYYHTLRLLGRLIGSLSIYLMTDDGSLSIYLMTDGE